MQISSIKSFNYTSTITIDADSANVWAALTETEALASWLGEPEMGVEVQTAWQIGSSITIRGFHHVHFENKGVILCYEPGVKLSYSHLSSISRLPDLPANYSVLEFELVPKSDQTVLTLILSNFPTETIRKHLEFYWRVTLPKIKQYVERTKLP